MSIKAIVIRLMLMACAIPAFAQGSMRRVDTLDELLMVRPVQFATAGKVSYSVSGNKVAGDYGVDRVADWERSSNASTNRGNVFICRDGGRWIFRDRKSPSQDVRWWGAIADDGLDDTAALQALLDSGAKLIQLPQGAFNLSGDGITMSSPAYILGSQRGASIFDYSGTADALTISSGTTDTQVIGPRVEEVTFFGRTTGGSAPRSLVRVQNATRGTIQRCSFTWDRVLGYPLEGSKNIWLNEQVWIWSIRDCQIGYADSGIYMSATNSFGAIVSAVEVNGGEIFGNRYGILSGYTNRPSSSIGNGAYRLVANIWIKGTTIEANGAYGVWLNGAEQVTIDDIYTEANGHLYQTNGAKVFTNEVRSADIALGNQFDTSTNFSVGSVKINGVRFADCTNAVVAYSGREIDIANNLVLGGRGTNFVFSPNVRNVTVWENNTSASQSSGYPSVHDNSGVVAYRRKSADASGLPIVSQTAIPRFGDFDLSDVYWTAERAFNLQPPVAVQTISPNKPVGFMGVNWGRSGYPRSGWVNDGTNVIFLSKTETAGAALPFSFDINGTEQFRVETNTARFRGNVTVHTMTNVDNLTVDGSIAAGSPPEYAGSLSGSPTYRLSISAPNTSNTLGTVLYSHDGTYNAVAKMTLDPTPGAREFVIGMAYTTGGNIPVRIKSPIKGIIGEFFDPGTNWTSLRLNLNGALEEVRWDPISKTLYTGLTVPPVSTNGHQHATSDITSGTFIGERLGSNTPTTNLVLFGGGAGQPGRWQTVPSTPSPTNGIADAPADSTFYGRRNNAWTGPIIGDVSGLQTELDDIATALDERPTYTILQEGITLGPTTLTDSLTLEGLPTGSLPGTTFMPLIFDSSGNQMKKFSTNDLLVLLDAAPKLHSHFSNTLDSAIAYKDQGNTFTETGNNMPDLLLTQGSFPHVDFTASSLAGSSKNWRMGINGLDFVLSAMDSTFFSATPWLTTTRSGTSVTNINFTVATGGKVRVNTVPVVTEAPIDGLEYVRKDGEWKTNSIGSSPGQTFAWTNMLADPGVTLRTNANILYVGSLSPLVLASGSPVTITGSSETSLISLRSGESKTLPVGYLTSGTVLRLEAEGEMTSGGGGANWANGLFRWKVGGLTITFTVAEPLSEDADHNTWSLKAFLVIQTAGSNASVKASGYVDYEYTTIVNPTRSTIRIRPVVSGTLNTGGSNVTDLTFENQGTVLTEFVGSAVVLQRF